MARRRCSFLSFGGVLLCGAILVATAQGEEPPPTTYQYGTSTTLLADHFGGIPGFYHGVASGDPLPTSIILWTRYTPESADDVIELELRVAVVDDDDVSVPRDDLLDPERNPNMRSERILVSKGTDFAAKVDLTGLEPGSRYVFAFLGPEEDESGTPPVEGLLDVGQQEVLRTASPVGQTRTAPDQNAPVSELRYAVFSCATYTEGYFHSYDVASTIKDIDLYVHVGDYIYEYARSSSYASDSAEREEMLRPQWETVTVQDYRHRYAVYAEDEAVQNLRRRAPLFAIWDDHEIADNAYGKGADPSQAGAVNHQETCPVDWRDATNEEMDEASCEFDEGSVVDRFSAAARAYMDWMPVRSGPGSMGVVDPEIGSLTRVMQWGNLATFIAFDTRVSQRSKEPTLANVFEEFAEVAAQYRTVSEYSIPGPARDEIEQVAANVKAKMNNPQYTMIGEEMIELIRETFAASKQSGKPWQMMLSPTLMGPNVSPNPATMSAFVPPEDQADVQSAIDVLLSAPVAGLFLRIVAAMAVTMTPWNRDDFNGFASERSRILDIFRRDANNAIVLSGDLHDSWLWQLYEGGNHTGTPVAVNLGGPGVTAPGFGRSLLSAFGLIADSPGDMVKDGWEAPLGGGTEGSEIISFGTMEKAFLSQNPGLKHTELRHEGFIAVKVTAKDHIAEYIHVGEGNILSDYNTARAENDGGLTAGFFCSGKFTTQAGMPGSLAKELICDAIEFESDRPAEWSIPLGKRDSGLGIFATSDAPLTMRSRFTQLLLVLSVGVWILI